MGKGADANITNDKGLSAYDLAKKWKVDLNEMKALDAKNPDHDGTLPLFYAAKYAHLDVIEMLVKAGADINHQDIDGETAYDQEKDFKFLSEEVKALLKPKK